MGTMILLLLFCFIVSPVVHTQEEGGPVPIEVLEDRERELTFDIILAEGEDLDFIPYPSTRLSFGTSRSAWWIRLSIDAIQENDRYLGIYNPSVARAVLYLPIHDQEDEYKALQAGWYFRGETQEEGFTFPVFKLKNDFELSGEYLYVNLYSPFTQNYDIYLMTEQQFTDLRSNTWLVFGLLSGFLLAMLLYNTVVFVVVKDRAYFFYVLFILALMAYQLDFLGILHSFFPHRSHGIVIAGQYFAFCMIVAAIQFVRAFFNTVENVPKHDRILRYYSYGVVIGLLLLLTGQMYYSNIFIHFYSLIGSLFILEVAIIAWQKGFQRGRFFFFGWLFMVLALLITVGRHIGILPNTGWTLYAALVALGIKSILLSMALLVRVRRLHVDKEIAQIHYALAAQSSRQHRLAFLRAQVKPHFIHNAMNVISHLIKREPEKARTLIQDFSHFLRGSFRFEHHREMSTLGEEIKLVQAYLSIEKARFQERLQVEYDIREEAYIPIPALSLQPLVENAVGHGLMKKLEGGTVRLSVWREDTHTCIEVKDDGVGMTEEQIQDLFSHEEKTGVGVQNIHKRLQFHYGQGLTIESDVNKGTVVRMYIPLKEGD